VHLAEKHDLNGYERKSDELIRLVESPRLEPRHVFRLRVGDSVPPALAGTFAAKGPTVPDTEAHEYWARIGHELGTDLAPKASQRVHICSLARPHRCSAREAWCARACARIAGNCLELLSELLSSPWGRHAMAAH
jgi:hypothetical protein